LFKTIITAGAVAVGLTAAAYADPPPISHDSGFNAGPAHFGAAACHIFVNDPSGGPGRVPVGIAAIQRVNPSANLAQSQCDALRAAVGHSFLYSLTGNTVLCTVDFCPEGFALEIGDVVVQ